MAEEDEKEPQEKGAEGEELKPEADGEKESPKADKERTTPRKSVNDSKRATNLFGGMLKHMQTAKKDLTKERTGDAAKKKLEAIGKAEDKIAQHKTETALAARAMGDIKGKGKGMMGKGMMMDEMKGKGKGKGFEPPPFAAGTFGRMIGGGMRSEREAFDRVPARGDPRDDPRGPPRDLGRFAPREDPRDVRGLRREDPRDRREDPRRPERDPREERAREKEKERERGGGEKEREREKATKKAEEEAELKDMYTRLAKHYECMGHFIRTKVEPTIFYIPAQHNSKTRKLLAETQEAISGKVRGLEQQAAAVGRPTRERPAERERERERDRSRSRHRDRRR